MSTVTLQDIEARQTELADLIAKFKQQGQLVTLVVPEAFIDLAPGERYAGLVLAADGTLSHHLVLLPGQTTAPWGKAREWAATMGGELPTRREQSLLFANLKAEFEAAWCWSGEEYESDGSSAWGQHFYYGTQYDYHKSYEGRARAVRRFPA